MDLYAILGVSKTATAAQIKAAYRKLSSINHPDKGGNAEKQREINDAYEILGNEDRRKRYDENGSTTDPEEEKRNRVSSALTSLFNRVLDDPMMRKSVVFSCRKVVRMAIAELNSEINELKVEIVDFKVMKNRVRHQRMLGSTSKVESDIYSQVIDSKIDNLLKTLKAIQGARELNIAVSAAPEDYYDVGGNKNPRSEEGNPMLQYITT